MVLDNPRWEKFAQKYAELLNLGDAYLAAGYKVRTRAAAQTSAARLFGKAIVADRVAELLRAGASRAELRLEDVLEEIRLVAFARASKAATWSENGIVLIDSTQLEEAELAAIAEVSETEIEMGRMVKRTLKVKMHDKLSALDKLVRRLDGYPRQKVDITSDGEKIPLAVFAAALAAGGPPPDGK